MMLIVIETVKLTVLAEFGDLKLSLMSYICSEHNIRINSDETVKAEGPG